jgi:hypothetical protein
MPEYKTLINQAIYIAQGRYKLKTQMTAEAQKTPQLN